MAVTWDFLPGRDRSCPSRPSGSRCRPHGPAAERPDSGLRRPQMPSSGRPPGRGWRATPGRVELFKRLRIFTRNESSVAIAPLAYPSCDSIRNSMDTRPSRATGLLRVAAILGILLTGAGVILSVVRVTLVPRSEGPRATALIGGGEAEAGGVTLRVGDYTVSAGDPQYAGTATNTVQAICRSNDGAVSGGKITQHVLPITVFPTGISKCLPEGGRLEVDHARLMVQVDKVGVVQAKPAVTSRNKFLPLSRVDAQVQKPRTEILVETGVLVLLASGPELIIGALIPLLQSWTGPSSMSGPWTPSRAFEHPTP